MAISSSGIGSNLDIEGIVTQLMALEQRPLTVLAKKEATFQAKISALGSLKGAISALQTAASALIPATGTTAAQKFMTIRAAIADSAIAGVSASSSAVAGTYALEVTQLAQEHRIATSTNVTPFSGPGGTLVSGGTLTIRLDTKPVSGTPTKTTDVTIAAGATPEMVRDAINGANTGVSATVVNGTLGKQLVLTGDTAGSNQFITLSGVAGLAYDPSAVPDPLTDAFAEAQTAQGSAFKLNGIAVTANTNTVTTAVDGLTLTLTKQSAAGVATTITLSKDTASLSAALNAFVKAYNDVNGTITSLGSYNATTKAAGTLNGDSTLRSAQGQLRSLIGGAPSALAGANLQRLSDIGVSVQKDGSLSVDTAKLDKAVKADFTGVANLVSAYGSAFKTATASLVDSGGLLVARTDGLNASIKSLGKQRDAVSYRLTRIEANYRKQFTALDTLVSGMNATSNYLAQQLANLPTYG